MVTSGRHPCVSLPDALLSCLQLHCLQLADTKHMFGAYADSHICDCSCMHALLSEALPAVTGRMQSRKQWPGLANGARMSTNSKVVEGQNSLKMLAKRHPGMLIILLCLQTSFRGCFQMSRPRTLRTLSELFH